MAMVSSPPLCPPPLLPPSDFGCLSFHRAYPQLGPLPLRHWTARSFPCSLLRAQGNPFCQRGVTMQAQAVAVPCEPARKGKRRESDGVVIVDHGSRRAQSNSMFYSFVEMYKQKTGHPIVEAAHMELANPTIAEAFDRCVQRGADRVIITPYFLSPGRHWEKDIPTLAAEAAKMHPSTPYIVTAPIGLHELMVKIVEDRIERCLSHAAGDLGECNICSGTGICEVLQANLQEGNLT